MKNTHTKFTGSIPENYDTYLGPLLFEFSGEDIGKRLSSQVPQAGEVLEIAAGTGISTKYIRKHLPESVAILATDLNPDMLEYAKKTKGDLPNVTYQVADAMNLPFADNRFDGVVCQFGIMFYPDKLKGFTEMFRVIKPGAPALFNVWDSFEHNKVVGVVRDVIASFFETEPPKFLDIPFGYNDIDLITSLMKEAGFTNVTSNIVSKVHTDLTAESIARGLVEGNPSVVQINERATVDSATIVKESMKAIEGRFGGEKPEVKVQEIVFSGIKPK